MFIGYGPLAYVSKRGQQTINVVNYRFVSTGGPLFLNEDIAFDETSFQFTRDSYNRAAGALGGTVNLNNAISSGTLFLRFITLTTLAPGWPDGFVLITSATLPLTGSAIFNVLNSAQNTFDFDGNLVAVDLYRREDVTTYTAPRIGIATNNSSYILEVGPRFSTYNVGDSIMQVNGGLNVNGRIRSGGSTLIIDGSISGNEFIGFGSASTIKVIPESTNTLIVSSNISPNSIIEPYIGIGTDTSFIPYNVTVGVGIKTTGDLYHGIGSTSVFLIEGLRTPYFSFMPGKKYRFFQSDPSNAGNLLQFYTDSSKTTKVTSGVTTSGISPGNPGSYVQISVHDTTPSILYYDSNTESYLGNNIMVPGSSNMSGITTVRTNDVEINRNLVFANSISIGNTTTGSGLSTSVKNNILIGKSAGSVLTTGDRNIVLGNLSPNVLTATSNDSLVVGYGATPWIYKKNNDVISRTLSTEVRPFPYEGKIFTNSFASGTQSINCSTSLSTLNSRLTTSAYGNPLPSLNSGLYYIVPANTEALGVFPNNVTRVTGYFGTSILNVEDPTLIASDDALFSLRLQLTSTLVNAPVVGINTTNPRFPLHVESGRGKAATAVYADGNLEVTGILRLGRSSMILDASDEGAEKVTFGNSVSLASHTQARSSLMVDGSIASSGSIESFVPAGITTTLNVFKVTVGIKTTQDRYYGIGHTAGYKIEGMHSPYLTFIPGKTYRFDQEDPSNVGYDLRFYTDANKTQEITLGVTTSGVGAGDTGSYVEILTHTNTPMAFYYDAVGVSNAGNQIMVMGSSNMTTAEMITANSIGVSTDSYFTHRLGVGTVGFSTLTNYKILTVFGDIKVTGKIYNENDELLRIGIPSSTNTTIQSTDAGKHLNVSSTVTINSSTNFEIGDTCTIYNNSDSTIGISTSSVTLRFAGTSSTVDRYLSQRGIANLLCVGVNDYVITGTGLT
jgi:hypothetical protein